MSQEALAKVLKVARTNYVSWEQPGGKTPTAPTLKKIAKAIGISVEELTTTDREETTLRDLREWAGLTQAGMAERLGLADGGSWAGIENGSVGISDRHVKTLMRTLGVTAEELEAAWERSRPAPPT